MWFAVAKLVCVDLQSDFGSISVSFPAFFFALVRFDFLDIGGTAKSSAESELM